MSGAVPLLPPTCLHGVYSDNFMMQVTSDVTTYPVLSDVMYDRQCYVVFLLPISHLI